MQVSNDLSPDAPHKTCKKKCKNQKAQNEVQQMGVPQMDLHSIAMAIDWSLAYSDSALFLVCVLLCLANIQNN